MAGLIIIRQRKREIQFILEGEIYFENGAMSVLRSQPDQLFSVNIIGDIVFQSSDSTIYPIEHQNFSIAPFVTAWNQLNITHKVIFSFSGLLDPRPVDAFSQISLLNFDNGDEIKIGNSLELNIFINDNAWYDNFTVDTYGEHASFNILESNITIKRLPFSPKLDQLTSFCVYSKTIKPLSVSST